MKELTVIYQETGQFLLDHPRVIRKVYYDLSGFALWANYFLIRDIDNNSLENPIAVATDYFEYQLTEIDNFKGIRTTTEFYARLVENEETFVVPEVATVDHTETKEEYLTTTELEALLEKVRADQIRTLRGTVKGTPFEANVSQIIDWYHVELGKFIQFGLDSFKNSLLSESDPDRLAVLDAIPLPDLLPDVSAKTNILNRLNAYQTFVDTNS